MSEEEQKQKKVRPGLVKSEGYSRPKTNNINKTLKIVEDTLPVTQKTEMYSQYYEEVQTKNNWIPPQGELNITEEMLTPSASSNNVTPNKNNIQANVEKPKKFEKPKPKEEIIVKDVPNIKQNMTSEMELAMQNVRMMQQESKTSKSASFEIPETMNVELPTAKQEKVDIFESVKNMPVTNEVNKEEVIKENLVKEKPFMRIDKVEVRTSVNEDGEKVYMVAKKVYNKTQFMEYLQEVGGRILAADCKLVEVKDTKYTLQPDGSYQDSQGNLLSVDDMLALINEK